MSSGSLKNVINKMFTNHIYLIYAYICMHKEDLTLNYLLWLIYNKTQQNQTRHNK